MDGLRNDDTPRSAVPADLENQRLAAADTAAGEDESGVETNARIPVSRNVIIDERQQPLPASEATSTTTTTAPASPSTGASPAGVATVASPAAGRDVASETGTRASRPGSAAADISAEQDTGALLFPEVELQQIRTRWDQLQASFVDDPKRAVQDADKLVASAVKRIADQFAEQRAKLEAQWSRGDDATTEELRRSLRQYRAFFERLLSM